MNHQKRLGFVILAVLIGGGTALAPFSQATPTSSAVVHATTRTHPTPAAQKPGAQPTATAKPTGGVRTEPHPSN